MSPDLSNIIKTNAEGPRRAAGDSGSMEQHSLPDQIAAQRFLNQSENADKTPFGLRFRKLKPPGAT